nr:hypothetical protein [Tanacetum cinerariifolium]
PFGPPSPASGGPPHLSDQDPGVGGYRQTRRVGRVASSRRIRVGSWNIGTLTGKFFELVDTLRRKKVDIVCFHETKWKGLRNREGNQYKLWYSGSVTVRNGVGVALAPNLKDKVVQRVFDDPAADHIRRPKRPYWSKCGWILKRAAVHGSFGYRVRNEKGRTILEFAMAHDLVVVNLFFKKRDTHLITFHSGDHDTHIDYLLMRKRDLRLCKDYKVFLGEVCFSQRRLLALDIHIKRRTRSMERAAKPKILWKNLYGETTEAFRARVIERATPEEEDSVAEAEQMWNRLANTIREAAKKTLGVVAGTLRTRIGRRESWWISDEVQDKVKAKQAQFRKLISMRGADEANRSATEEREKTEYMRSNFNENENDRNEEEEIRIGKHILEPNESFRYLGSVIHKSERIEDDVTYRIQVGWLKWRAATGILCDNKVPLKLKGKFYRLAIRPTMLYGSEWPLTKVQANRMEVAEMRMLRWTCGRLRWFGHVKRRPQSAPVRRVKSLTVDGARRRGRPKLRWEDRLKTETKELLLSEDMTFDRNT